MPITDPGSATATAAAADADRRYAAQSAVLAQAAEVLLALAHPRRLAVLNAVAEAGSDGSPAHLDGLAQLTGLAERTGLDARTLSKELGRLIEAGLIVRQDGGFRARFDSLSELSSELGELTALGRIVPPGSPLRRYLTHGRLTTYPRNPDDLRAVAAAAAELLPDDRCLTEAEVNELLAQADPDTARLRRLLADLGLVTRTGSAEYRRTGPEGRSATGA